MQPHLKIVALVYRAPQDRCPECRLAECGAMHGAVQAKQQEFPHATVQ